MKTYLACFAALTWVSVSLPCSLRAADATPPTVLSVSPPAGGVVSNLTQVIVSFSEPVSGVEAADFLINAQPANAHSGASNLWTFSFSQPPAGLVEFAWDASHAIYDLAGSRFEELGPGARWSYTLADTIPPTVLTTAPTPGAVVAALAQIEVTFQEAVSGVDATDLLINGQAASEVTGFGAGPYLFSFAPPTNGVVAIRWASGHGIADLAPLANAFAGGAWTNTLHTNFTADIVLNEIMADNLNGLLDEDGDAGDWLELFNRGSNNVSLLGWSLTDDAVRPGQWVLPAVTLNAGQYLIVFADGKDRATTGPLTNHANFTLGGSGYLGLYNAQGPRQVVSEFAPAYPEQRGDISWGRTSSNTFAYFATATPGATNSSPTNYSGFAAMPQASAGSGLYAGAFLVALGCATPGAAIYFTTNGDAPNLTNATLYTGLFPIAGSSNKAVIPLRAAAFKAGLLPSAVLTRTYIFPDQVLFQPIRPAGFPTQWVSEYTSATADTVGDYEMDPQVLTNGANRQIARQALAEIPTVSLVTSIGAAFGPTNGVYSGRRKRGNQRAVNAEMILPNGERVFQRDCGFEIQGGSSPTDANADWKDKKLSLRLVFKGDFGTPKLRAKVFEDSPVEEFDTLILDAGLNWWWTHMTDGDQRNRAKFVTDTITSDLMNNAGLVAQHTRFVHLYLDGLYWGLYWLHERMDEAAAASYLGGQKEEWDVLKHTGDTAGLQNGSLTNYTAMLNVARSGLTNNATYEQLQTFLDVPWFIDYMIVNFWVGNDDWPHHNWYAWRRTRSPGAPPWRFVSWDAEHTFKNYAFNSLANGNLNSANHPGELFRLLINNVEFRIAFGDHVQKLMFNGGPLYTTPNTAAFWTATNPSVNLPGSIYRKRVDEIWNSVVCESARWGDVATNNANNPYTRELHYTRELNSLFSITNTASQTVNYFPLRGSNVLALFVGSTLYPSVAAPAYHRHGGRIAAGFSLFITNVAGAGTVYYTTNGADPRVYAAGTVSPQAVAYAGTPVVIGQTMTVRARALVNGTNWSALNEATFTVGSLGVPLRITEIMYNPIGADAYEFVELLNTGTTDLALGGYSFDGITFAFAPGYVLPAGTRIVLASSLNPAAFAARYPGVVVAGYFGGILSNGGERIAVKDAAGNTVISVDYDDENGWPTAADGGGYSLEIIDANGNPDAPANWRASAAPNGTPGQSAVALPVPGIVLNEVMAENFTTTNNGGTYPDWVELYNASAGAVNLTGWSLSDNGNPRRFVFTNGPVLAAGDYFVVWCDTNNAAPGLHTGFGLDKDGGSVFLYDANTNRADAISFGAQLADYTIGRVGGAWSLTSPTPGATNVAVVTASITNVVINEWLANAAPGGSDWVELYNGSLTQPAALSGIYLGTSNAVFHYTALAFLPPGGFLQLLADELPGPRHLDFKLPASAGAIVLYDTAGLPVNRVTYGAQVQGVSQGRLPNGHTNAVLFPGSASPSAANYALTYSGPSLNEVLARNKSGAIAPWGVHADWIEIVRTNGLSADLSGMGLSDQSDAPKWIIPATTVIPGTSQLRIWCDGSRPASTNAGDLLMGGFNSGFSLSSEAGGVYLFATNGQVVDFVEYGFQVADLSIGRSGGGWRLLASPTPGMANSAPAPLGSVAGLRFNEWSTAPWRGNDWFEMFNTGALPVELSGLYLSDDGSLAGLTQFQVAPLSFIGAKGFVKFEADDDPSQGANHVNFDLDALGESLRLYGTNLALLDAVDFGPQPVGTSMGRLLDGATSIVAFTTTLSPGEANYLPLSNAVVNEVLTHTDAPWEDAIEMANPSRQGADLSGWFLSNSQDDFKKYRIADGTFLAAGGYVVFYETQFNSGASGSFTLNSAHGDAVYLSEADAAGNLSGYRAVAKFGAAEKGMSLGRFATCVGVDFTAMSARTLGVDTPLSLAQFRTGAGLPNAYPKVGPVVIDELMYHPPGLGLNDNTVDEYIELCNVSAGAVPLFDPMHATNTWRLRGAVDFDFPQNVTLDAGACLLVVPFDPVVAPQQLAAFRALYNVATNVPVFGPFRGKLDNGGESVKLESPDTPQTSPHPDAGFVPHVLVDRVDYSNLDPWPVAGNGDGASLQRRVAIDYGNDPWNWIAASPTAGLSNAAVPALAPTIVVQPVSRAVSAGSRVVFSVEACGGRPLNYQWMHAGTNLPGATDASLILASAQPADEGNYLVLVSNGAGNASSATATLTLMSPPVITMQPQAQSAPAGGVATFTVQAGGPGPVSYQWRFNGVPISGATDASVVVSNLSFANVGAYSVLVGNPAGVVASSTAHLIVVIPPNITSPPQSLSVLPGTNVAFSVVASGTGILRYQWRFNSLNIVNATNVMLSLSNVQLPDHGPYSVVVTDDLASTTSQTAFLTVRVAPTITQPLTGHTVAVGSTVTLNVTATGTPPLGYRWRKAGSSFQFKEGISALILTNVQASSATFYDVIVTNQVSTTGVISTNKAFVTAVWPPPNQNGYVGSNVTFNAAVAGVAFATYRWLSNGVTIADATTTNLTLTNITVASAGTYTLVVTVATNGGGSPASFDAILAVSVLAPAIVTQPASQTVLAGTNVTFNVAVSGSPPLRYQWKFNDVELAGMTNASLLLTNVQLANEGNYSVMVTNVAGPAPSQNAFLTVLIRPVLSDLQRLPDGTCTMNLFGNTNRNYCLEISTNVVDWSNLTTVLYTNGLMNITDASATNAPLRFYRARLVQ